MKECIVRNLKEKLWYEVYESVVTHWSELPAEQKSEKGVLVSFLILLGIISVDFDITGTDNVFCICQILEKKRDYNEVVHQLCIVFKKAYDSVRREVLYNILTVFGVYMKLERMIKMWLNETCIRVRVGKYLSGMLSTLLWSTPLGGFI